MFTRIDSCLRVAKRARTMKISIILFVTLCFFSSSYARKGFGGTEQEWGFVNVRSNAYIFWWLYYTTADVEDFRQKPLILRLEGGPGDSSTGYGNFRQLGPIDDEGNSRNFTWIKDYNVLFIDHPVGVGFSYVENDLAYTTNNDVASNDVLTCMKSFFAQYPEFSLVPTYISGESYGGRVAAQLTYDWYKAERAGEIQSTLKGTFLIEPWVSPIDYTEMWPAYLQATGMIDSRGYDNVNKAVMKTREAVDAERWYDAMTAWMATRRVIWNETGNLDFLNIMSRLSVDTDITAGYLDGLEEFMNGRVKDVLGVDVNWYTLSDIIVRSLWSDFMRPSTEYVEYMLNNTDLNIVVSGAQFDVVTNTLGAERWVNALKWPHSESWLESPRELMIVDDIIEGSYREYKNLGLYWILRSGHLSTGDNPAAMAFILEKLTSNSGL